MTKKTLAKHYITALAAIASLGAFAPSIASAASGTWNGATNSDWVNAGNWSAVPGVATGVTNNAEVATFQTDQPNGTTNPIVTDTNRNLGSMNFTTAAGSYVIGNTAGPALLLSSGGATQILAALTAGGITETINAPIILEPASGTAAGAYTFANNGTDSTTTLNFAGAISAGTTTAAETLTLNGTNTGANTITGDITNGNATTFAITKSGAGTWTLNDTITINGAITVNGGVLNLAGAINGASPISITAGGILNISGTDTGGGAVTLTSGALNVTGNAGNSGGNLLGTGAITVTNNTLSATSATAGTFGLGTGNVALNSVISLSASAGNAVNYTAANATLNSTKLTFGLVGGNTDTLALNANGGTLSFTVGNSANTSGVALTRAAGAVLIISPSAVANLGASEQFFVNGQAPTTGTIYGPYVMVRDTPANNSIADFVTYTGATNGFQAASIAGVEVNQSATDINSAAATDVFNVDQAGAALTDNRQIFALRTAFSVDTAGNTLTIGSSATTAGLILNGNDITIGTTANVGGLSFGNTGTAEGIIYTAQTATINANITAKGGLTLAGTGTLTINGDIALGTSSSFINNPGNVIINGKLSSTSAAASIRYMGAGNLTLTGDNSGFTGTFTVGPASDAGTTPLGTLTINNSNAMGTGNIQFYMGSVTSHTTLDITNDITLNGPTFVGVNGAGGRSFYAVFSGTGNLILNGLLTSGTNNTLENDLAAGKAIVYAGGITLPPSGNTLVFTGSGDNIISGPITGGPINYAGTGDITIGHANPLFTGGFAIGGAVVSGAATVTLGDPAGFGTGTLSVDSANSVTGPLITLQTTSDMSIANNVVLGTAANGSRRVSVFGGTHSMNFTGNISLGSNQIFVVNNVASPASLTFSGPSFVLNAPGGNAFTFTITGTGDTFISAPISGNPNPFVSSSTGTLTLSGANTFNGPFAISAGTVSVATINSVVGGSASSNLGAPSTPANGIIAIGSATVGGTLLYTGTGETTDRVINLAGTTGGATIDQSGTGSLEFKSAFTATGGGVKTLTLQGSTAGTGQIDAAIVNRDATNKTSLTKAGTGTWTLSGTNTYTGATTITGGTLVLAGSGVINSGSPITVSGAGAKFLNNSSVAVTAPVTIASGTIGGSGTISSVGGISIGANATVSPGNSPAAQSYTTGMTFAPAGTYKWEINLASGTAGTNFDQLAITGAGLNVTASADIGSQFTIDITSLTGANTPGLVSDFDNTQNYAWKIADTSGVTGYDPSEFALSTADFANSLGSGSFAIHLGTDPVSGVTLDNSANSVYLTFTGGTPVPEPASLALLALGAAALLTRRKQDRN